MDAIRKQVRWWQTTALLEVAGPESATLLDGLCTQAVARIEPGTARLGLFLNAKAAIIAPAVLHRIDDERFLVETLPDLADDLAAHLRRYRLRARVTIGPSSMSTIAVLGPRELDLGATDNTCAITRRIGYGTTMHAVFADAPTCSMLVETLQQVHGMQLADPDELESARIDAGQADLHDLLPGRMPAEVGAMAEAVALDAGCYLGQEPVARLHYRGHANRTLRRLRAAGELKLDGTSEPADLLTLHRASDDARPVGQLTTWARRGDGSTAALAVLRREIGVGEPLVVVGSDLILHPIEDSA